MSDSVAGLITQAASTQRSPAVSGGKRGARANHLTSLYVMPLMPASAQTMQNSMLAGAARELWETYTCSHAHTDDSVAVTQLPDIRQGDVLVVSSREYKIVYVGDWGAVGGAAAYLQLVMEEIKAEAS